VRGMDITVCTTANTDAEGQAMLAAFGFPFRSAAAEPGVVVEPVRRQRRSAVRRSR